MAISAPHYRLMRDLKPILPHGGKLLEIGEANWYGDTNATQMVNDTEDTLLRNRLGDAIEERDNFAIAKIFYQILFAPSLIHSVDFNGTAAALKQDLNRPLRLAHSYDVIINHGTAEHIFNIAQVFKSIHDACKVGGLMIHESPFVGWIDHGFYCLQPTLFYDLAAANGYAIVKVAIESIKLGGAIAVERREHIADLAAKGSIPPDAMLFVVFRKVDAGDFKLPMQGYYDGVLTEEGRQAWETMR